jgi:hypothetical protein
LSVFVILTGCATFTGMSLGGQGSGSQACPPENPTTYTCPPNQGPGGKKECGTPFNTPATGIPAPTVAQGYNLVPATEPNGETDYENGGHACGEWISDCDTQVSTPCGPDPSNEYTTTKLDE